MSLLPLPLPPCPSDPRYYTFNKDSYKGNLYECMFAAQKEGKQDVVDRFSALINEFEQKENAKYLKALQLYNDAVKALRIYNEAAEALRIYNEAAEPLWNAVESLHLHNKAAEALRIYNNIVKVL